MRRSVLFVPLLLATSVAAADAVHQAKPSSQAREAQAQKDDPAKQDPKTLDGMSILGNQEAPKALVIVPWKGSELGGAIGITPMLDDSRAPVDREVFLRALSYYEIKSDSSRHDGAPPRGQGPTADGSNAAQATPAARRSKS